MNKEALLSKLDHLELKLNKLIKDFQVAKVELEACQESNKQLKLVIAQQNEELKNFHNQHKISKIVASIADGTQSSPELKLKINEYIREIDKCIAYLSE